MVELEEVTEVAEVPGRRDSAGAAVSDSPPSSAGTQVPGRVSSSPASDDARDSARDGAPTSTAPADDPAAADRAVERPNERSSSPSNSEEKFVDAPEEDPGSAQARASEEPGAAQARASEEAPGGASGEGRRGEEEEEFEDSMDEEGMRKAAIAEAERAKSQGNTAYVSKDYARALELYASALDTCPAHPDSLELRAACHSNRAICCLCLDDFPRAVTEASAALELKPGYVKALLRRAQAQEKLDKLEEALADVKQVLELDGTNQAARESVKRLEPIVDERREKLKEEMLGKLKDLGNSILGNFGLSVDNFKAVQDPTTGSYSINFQN